MPEETITNSRGGRSSLTEGPIFSSLMWFTLPFLLSNLLQTLYGTVDTLVIGNFGSA